MSQKREEKERRDKLFGMIADFVNLASEAMRLEKPAPVDLLAQQLDDSWYDLEAGDCWDLRDSDKQMSDLLEYMVQGIFLI